MAATRTRSSSPAKKAPPARPSSGRARGALLRRLKVSPEVAWYLESRGIPLPDCPPKFKTPEPRRMRGARFDPDRVDRVLEALSQMRHTQGQWAGLPLTPDPWQVAYVIAPVYGWVAKNEHGIWVRIVRTQFVDLPRKNGKTTLAGGQALYLTGGDREPGAQVLAAAAGKDQANYCFAPVKALAEGAPGLKKHFRPLATSIVHKRSMSSFRVVSSIADLLHGANVHGAVIDELHVHKTRDLVDAIETGTGARTQPMVIIITTADDGRQDTIYAEKRLYAEQLARKVFADFSFYAVIWGADDKDDPFAEATWKKANPGYGISPTKEFLEQEARKAKQSPANLARFLRLHLGLRTKQETKYLELAKWDRNAGQVDEDALVGRIAYGGLDLASTTDLAALAWLFPDSDQSACTALWRIWTPEARLKDLDRRTAGQASVWVRDGLLTLTPGDAIDYDWIRRQLIDDRDRFDVQEVGYDPWNATGLVTKLTEEGAPMVPIRQGFATMSAPTKELQRLVGMGTLQAPVFRHGANPAVRWQVDNLAVKLDPAENVKPDKESSGDKIDAIVAAIIALACWMVHRDAPRSIYEDDDLEFG